VCPADARSKGAKLLGVWKRNGNLIHPLLIDQVTAEMKLAWEEQFGPVLPIMRIRDPQEAVEHCNASRFALQGCVFTRDMNTAMRISDAMRTGTVQVRRLLSF
jgi:glyceraldehyde-3-phosphate dehydrogenase (NADP+)